MATVSVVTTVYNGEKYVDRAESSILDQTYDDYEWILVEDGSTDDTPDRLRERLDDHERVELHFPGRLGRAGALNYGVTQASGEYIAIHDFDDSSYPQRLETQVEYLDANPAVGVTGSYYVLANKIRDERFVRKPPTEDTAIRRAFAQRIPFAHTLTMFRKKAWNEVNGYPLRDNLIDLGLWLEIATHTDWQFANVTETLGEHFVHEESFWHQNFTYIKRQRDLAQLQIRAIRELDLSPKLYGYVLGRLVYPFFPTPVKRFVRRQIARSEEEDV